MPETPSDEQPLGAHNSRSGSARADFVANLGKKVTELRSALRALEQDPSSSRLRDELRRRIHALSAGARLLGFRAMAGALLSAQKLLEHAQVVGWVQPSDLSKLGEVIEAVPGLAWNQPDDSASELAHKSATSDLAPKLVLPPIVLVVGSSGLADVIAQPGAGGDDGTMDCERTERVEGALELGRALAPDVVVLDADLDGARELLEKLVKDPLTEPVPVILVGSFGGPDDAARWLAMGGVRALPKPVSPHALRQACWQAQRSALATPEQAPIGKVTVEALTERVVGELQRGLRDAVTQGQTTAIDFHAGTDVLAAVWGAVARIRDVVTIESGGAVRWSASGPEGALPIAPWWGENSGTGKRGGSSSADEMRLDGRNVVVADDDPAVTWFIGGVLRAAGALVREARDGELALQMCFRGSPDLVITDVLMPRLDGFALCRALKRDIALRDVPVILLSWKEDLLQRLRDLGADADGYLRKEASASAILQRVFEVLRPRTRIEARLRSEGEVRGRLDGVTPRSLLEITARVRPDARISIRDASFLYEVELRDGAPRSATRTTSDGSFERGKEVFGALLGVRAGRFVAVHAAGVARGTLIGSLDEQVELPITHARAALRLLGGTKLLEVHRVDVAIDRVLPYLGATPEPVRSLVSRLANGASPRALIIGGEVASAQLEDVLADLAAHAAIVGVYGDQGVDLLGPALATSLAAGRTRVPEEADSDAVSLLVVQRHGRAATVSSASPAPPASLVGVAFDLEAEDSDGPRPIDTQRLGGLARAPSASAPGGNETSSIPAGAEPPSSLAAAVMREISDRTPLPAPLPIEPTPVASIVDAGALKSRNPMSAAPTPAHAAAAEAPTTLVPERAPRDLRADAARTPIPRHVRTSSLPPDAVIPADPSSEPAGAPHAPPAPNRVRRPRGEGAARAVTSGAARTSNRRAVPLVATALATVVLLALGIYVAREPPVGPPSAAASFAAAPPFVPLAEPLASGMAATPAHPADELSAPTRVPSASPAMGNSPAAFGASPAMGSSPAALGMTPVGEDLPLPPGVAMNAAQGMLDIETGGREAIYVDGAELGRGPVLRLMLSPGVHEVRVRARAEERIRFVMIRNSRRTKLSLVSPWTR